MSSRKTESLVFGTGAFQYEAVPGWEQLPDGWSFLEVAGVATDSQNRVYVFCRGEHPLIVFDKDGKFLNSWGEGKIVRAHGATIGPDELLYLTDDLDHTVRKFTLDGKLLMTLGTSGQGSDTGVVDFDYRTMKQAGPPFHYPTNVAFGADGALYVSDGYGNARVHKFSAAGEHLFSWGEPGDGPGQFNLPHGIDLDSQGRVYVADRENSRVQIFTSEGKFLDAWTGLVRPTQVQVDPDDNVFITEVGKRHGLFSWMVSDPTETGGRLSIFSPSGELQARWGGGDDPAAPGDFFTPHDVCLDAEGSMYVGEVIWTGGGEKGLAPPNCHALQKFVRCR